MTANEKAPLDKLIPSVVEQVSQQVEMGFKPYFWKDDCIQALVSKERVAGLLQDLGKRYQAWRVDDLVLAYLGKRVGEYLSRTRDRYGIRQFECYTAGDVRRRWLPIRSLTASHLREILQESRVLERDIHLRGEGYHLALEALEALNDPRAKLGEVYDEIAPKIAAFKQEERKEVVA